MIRESLLKYRTSGAEIIPQFLGPNDYPWLRLAIAEYNRFIGRPKQELKKRKRQPFPFYAPKGKLELAFATLDRLHASKPEPTKTKPSQIRRELFTYGANRMTPTPQNWADIRANCVEETAGKLNMGPETVDKHLFSDFIEERLVPKSIEVVDAEMLTFEANYLLIQGFLFRAKMIQIEMLGASRPVIRMAKLGGLICILKKVNDVEILEISGPLVLFRQTLVYGRHLAKILPALLWTHRFKLIAEIQFKKHRDGGILRIDSSSPFFRYNEIPKQFDSKVEENFFCEFMRVAPDWDIIREPEPIDLSDKMIFPDFLLRSRKNPSETYLLEIIGFWTKEYLEEKIRDLNRAKIKNLILCVEEKKNCSDSSFPAEAKIVRYKGKIDAKKVLSVIRN